MKALFKKKYKVHVCIFEKGKNTDDYNFGFKTNFPVASSIKEQIALILNTYLTNGK